MLGRVQIKPDHVVQLLGELLIPAQLKGLDDAAQLVNELVEAREQNAVRRVLARWQKHDLVAIDELGCVPLAEVEAELLFQVIADRGERAAAIITTNLPSSE